MRRSALMITTDSGPRHFAAAFDVPVISLFGPTHIAWTRTYHPHAVHLFHPVPCGPCQKPVCPLGHHRCMTELTPDAVFRAAVRMLPSPAASQSRQGGAERCRSGSSREARGSSAGTSSRQLSSRTGIEVLALGRQCPPGWPASGFVAADLERPETDRRGDPCDAARRRDPYRRPDASGDPDAALSGQHARRRSTCSTP